MTSLYLILAIVIAILIYKAIRFGYDSIHEPDLVDIKEDSPSTFVTTEEGTIMEESLELREERLKKIQNPDIEKPFAKMSITTPVETQIINNVESKEEKLEEVEVSESTPETAPETRPIKPVVKRKPRKPKTAKSEEGASPATSTPKKTRKPYKKKPTTKLSTDENTTE